MSATRNIMYWDEIADWKGAVALELFISELDAEVPGIQDEFDANGLRGIASRVVIWARDDEEISLTEEHDAQLAAANARAERAERLAGLLERARQYLQHIDEVENSSCFYGCTCGASLVLLEIDAALAGQAGGDGQGE